MCTHKIKYTSYSLGWTSTNNVHCAQHNVHRSVNSRAYNYNVQQLQNKQSECAINIQCKLNYSVRFINHSGVDKCF